MIKGQNKISFFIFQSRLPYNLLESSFSFLLNKMNDLFDNSNRESYHHYSTAFLLIRRTSHQRLLWLCQHDRLGWLLAFFFLGCRQLCLASACCITNLRKESSDFFEKLLDINSSLSTDFFEEDIVLFWQFFALGFADFPFLQVDFVGEECDDDPIASLIFDVIHPFLDAFEGSGVGNVVDDDRNRSVSDVVGDQSLETFLACGVPELQTYGLVFEEDVLGNKIYADSGSLDECLSTCSLPSKIS